MAPDPRHQHPALTVLAFAVYAVLATGVVVGVGASVSAHAALAEPVHWGTYRQTDLACHHERHGVHCWSTGTWSAEDGGLVLRDVGLDDTPFVPEDAPTGPVRAGFRDWDADEDGIPATVYDAESVDGVWLPPLVVAGIALVAGVFAAARWGDLGRLGLGRLGLGRLGSRPRRGRTP